VKIKFYICIVKLINFHNCAFNQKYVFTMCHLGLKIWSLKPLNTFRYTYMYMCVIKTIFYIVSHFLLPHTSFTIVYVNCLIYYMYFYSIPVIKVLYDKTLFYLVTFFECKSRFVKYRAITNAKMYDVIMIMISSKVRGTSQPFFPLW
jgi:hypothetical protein